MHSTITQDQLRRAFADTVRILRERQDGMSQEKLARAAGVDRGYMGKLERELHTPTIYKIYQLLPALGVSFVQFASEFEVQLHSRRKP